MNKLSALLYITGAMFCSSTLANTLHFEIKELRSDKGNVYIQLFRGKENYATNNAEKSMQIASVEGSISVTFDALADGEYAIRYFHDENDNGSLETNMFGIPTEGFGYSNNAKPHYGPAKYQDMKFIISKGNTVTNNQSSVNY